MLGTLLFGAGWLIALVLIAAACSDDSVGPATTPVITASTTTRSVTQPPPSTTEAPSTTSSVTTTTQPNRLAEIQAIFQDLEERRLDALYRKDEEAFRELFANEGYLEESLVLFEVIEFATPPSETRLEVLELVADNRGCVAADVRYFGNSAISDGGEVRDVWVIELTSSSTWGLSFVGAGWTCDGPHPFAKS